MSKSSSVRQNTRQRGQKQSLLSSLRSIWSVVGPGIVTGAADDDPSGIATYTQTGAQFHYGQLWTVIFLLPLMIVVQEACARIGLATGKGIAAVVRLHYSRWILYCVVLLIVAANVINIGADIGAMAASAQLLFPLSFPLLVVGFGGLILVLEIFTSYKTYARILKWLAITLLAYPLTVFIVHLPWREVITATFIPHIQLDPSFILIITGVIGTTISPYMFFWEAAQEVEEEKEKHLIKNGKPCLSRTMIRSMRVDNAMGMVASQIATWCIIVVAATVLYSHGIRNVATAADAAKALEPLVQSFPLAGTLAKVIFSVGVIGLGLLAVPVLSASASYAVCEALKWREGLNLKPKRGTEFYGVIVVATLVGLAINFIGIDPIKALIYTAVFNGVASVPLLILITLVASNKRIMGNCQIGLISKVLLWITCAAVGLSAIALVWSFVAAG